MSRYFNYVNKKNLRIILIMVFMALILNIELFYKNLYWNVEATTPYLRYVLTGMALNHVPHKIIIWFLAIYPLLLGIESTLQEINLKTNYLLISRQGKMNYLKQSVIKNIKLPVMAIGIGLLVNFLINFVLFHGGQVHSETTESLNGASKYVLIQYDYPYITILIASGLLLLCTTLVAIQGTLFALLFEDRKIVYTSTFGIYYFFIASKFEITGILQPFDEYGFMRDFVPFVLFVVVYTLVIAVSFVLVRKKYAKIY